MVDVEPHRPAAEIGRLQAEIGELAEVIAHARREIATLAAGDMHGRHIPSATDELDAIVVHTAEATDAILEVCETLDEVANVLDGELSARLQSATSRIYEACSFQDIVGQRISKIVATLKMIDLRVSHLGAALGGDPTPASARNHVAVGAERADAHLLNGPQLPEKAMAQAAIDKLLADFD